MTSSNFPDGVTNASEETVFGRMTFPDPTAYHTYFNDFDVYTAGDWVVTETNAGATQALTAGNGGLLLITNTAADNDLVELQKTPAAFTLAAGKRAWFSAKFQLSDVTQNDLMVGLVVVNTDPINTPPTDGIYFLSADGVATAQIICRKNATTGSIAATVPGLTLVNATQVALQWYYDGAGKLFYGYNGNQVGVLDVSNYFPDTGLTVTFAMQAGEIGAETATVDYLFAALER